MPRRVLSFVATLLGPLILAAWILSIDSGQQIAKSENQEAPKGDAMEEGASRLDRAICVETGLVVMAAVNALLLRATAIDQGCEVKTIGIASYEVESSLQVRNRRTPVRYTVVVTEGGIDEKDGFFDGKWDKIRVHGFHRAFVPLSDFGIPKSRFQNYYELRLRTFLNGGSPVLRSRYP